MLHNSISIGAAVGLPSGGDTGGDFPEGRVLEVVSPLGTPSTVTLRLDSSAQTYPITVYWGDGTSSNVVSGDAIHSYPLPSTAYIISLETSSPPFVLKTDATLANAQQYVGKIYNWNYIVIGPGAFFYSWRIDTRTAVGSPPTVEGMAVIGPNIFNTAGTAAPGILSLDIPLSNITSLESAFRSCGVLSGDLRSWDVSQCTTMAFCFESIAPASVIDVSTWDTSSVLDMQFVFSNTENVNLGNIGLWNVSRVTNMSNAFKANDSELRGLGKWTVGSVTTMEYMFGGGNLGLTESLSSWDTQNVTTMKRMFGEADSVPNAYSAFNHPLSDWNLGSLTTVEEMFNSHHSNLKGLGGMSAANLEKTLYGWSVNPKTASGVNMESIVNSQPSNITKYTYAPLSDMDKALYDTTYGLITAKGWTGTPNITIA